MQKKCGRGLQDITPLLSNEQKTENEIKITMPLREPRTQNQIIDQSVKFLSQMVKGFEEIAREEILNGTTPVELLGIDQTNRPLLIKCAGHCGSQFLVESLEVLGTYKVSPFARFIIPASTRRKIQRSPLLIIIANTFAPEIYRALRALAKLNIRVYRLALENRFSFEQFDFERGEFAPFKLIPILDFEKQSRQNLKKRNRPHHNQLSFNLETELDDIQPLNKKAYHDNLQPKKNKLF